MKIVRQIKTDCNSRKLRVDTITHNKEITLNCFSAKVKNTTNNTILHIYTESEELIKSVAYNESYTLVNESIILCSSKVFFKIESIITPRQFDDSFDKSFG